MVDKQPETQEQAFKSLFLQEIEESKIEISEEDIESLVFRIFEMQRDPSEVVEKLFAAILGNEKSATVKRIVKDTMLKLDELENQSKTSKTDEFRRSEERNVNYETQSPPNKPSNYERNEPKFPEYETQRSSKKNDSHQEIIEPEKASKQEARFSNKTSYFEEKISGFETPPSKNKGLSCGRGEQDTFGSYNKPSNNEFERKKVSSGSPRSPLNSHEEEGKKDDLRLSLDAMSLGPREISKVRPRKGLESMLEDINKMPHCAERSLNEIICIVSSDIPSFDEVEKELKILETHLIKEELNTASIINSISKVKVCVKNQDWKESEYLLFRILKEIRPLNIQELIRLIEKVADAQKILEGKKAILLMGGTGSGISTVVHFLCGSKLVEGSDEAGLPHIYPVDVKNEAMRMITTSAGARSETKYITAIPLEDPSYVVCDTPGFQDITNAEFEIANGIGVIKAVIKCEQVKPVLIISEKGVGDRCQGLNKLARMVITIMPEFKENMDEITYFFTKFSEKEAELKSKFRNFDQMRNSEEKADIAFNRLFEDILIKLQDPKNLSAKVIDPINDNPKTVLKHLKDTGFIHDPEKIFKPFITPHSLEVLKQQLNKHKTSIIRAAETQNFELIEYKLDQLKILEHFIGDKEIKEVYDFCVNRIRTQINEEYKTETEAFNRRISSQLEIAREDVYEYRRALENSANFESLRNKHLS